MFAPPPLKEKPANPLPPLPVPRRKGVAAMIVLSPVVIGLVIGFLVIGFLGAISRWLPSAASMFLTSFVFKWLIISGAGVVGLFFGLRTLMLVLLYGAQEIKGSQDDQGHAEGADI